MIKILITTTDFMTGKRYLKILNTDTETFYTCEIDDETKFEQDKSWSPMVIDSLQLSDEAAQQVLSALSTEKLKKKHGLKDTPRTEEWGLI